MCNQTMSARYTYFNTRTGQSVTLLPPTTWPNERYFKIQEYLDRPGCSVGEYNDSLRAHEVLCEGKVVGVVPCRYAGVLRLLHAKIQAFQAFVRCIILQFEPLDGSLGYSESGENLYRLNDLHRRVLVDHQKVNSIITILMYLLRFFIQNGPNPPGCRIGSRRAEARLLERNQVGPLIRGTNAQLALVATRLLAPNRNPHWKQLPRGAGPCADRTHFW